MREFHPAHLCNDGVINTSSGRIINLKCPTPDMIDIKDIMNSLSKICRFGGHVTHYYSVAQHSVLVAYLMEKGEGKYGLEALMHDASEAYIGDVVKPLKVILGDNYRWLENMFENVIAKKFGLSQDPEVETLIHKYDMVALNLEHEAFQKGNITPLICIQEMLGIWFNGHANWDANDARLVFKGAFDRYMHGRDGKETNEVLSYLTIADLAENVG